MTRHFIKWIYPIWAALAAALLIASVPARATETLTLIHTDVAGSTVTTRMPTVPCSGARATARIASDG
jgi:hypothetical protein